MKSLDAPKAPSDQLCLECTGILARLSLIPELESWLHLEDSSIHKTGNGSAFHTLWNVFSLGAPLCTLLDLLGTPAAHKHYAATDQCDLNIALTDRQKFVTSFIQRVQLLEIQQRLPYGEVVRTDDLFNGSSSGFAKVVPTLILVNSLFS